MPLMFSIILISFISDDEITIFLVARKIFSKSDTKYGSNYLYICRAVTVCCSFHYCNEERETT